MPCFCLIVIGCTVLYSVRFPNPLHTAHLALRNQLIESLWPFSSAAAAGTQHTCSKALALLYQKEKEGNHPFNMRKASGR